ncbi:MAG TPA: hypothetical protein VMD56_14505 [Steroidobacteraceae bacterium]|nr:hypothetical protein [Steroidobacteraceae bacterium]
MPALSEPPTPAVPTTAERATVTVIGKANGVGLARDLELLAGALRRCGCEVQVHATDRADARRRRSLLTQALALARSGAWRRRRVAAAGSEGPRLRVNLMLEHVWPQFLSTAALNIAVPNPEWFDRRDRRLLASLDRVWAKTRHTQRIFEALGCPTAYIGFDSEDRYAADIPRERCFLHLAGKSRMKGTDRLLRLWARHPEWPTLVLVYHERAALPVPAAGNLRWYREYLPDAELRRLQNASRFHLCLSEAEGWGHYIVEALSVGAVTVTLDAPPMNELVTPERGLLVRCEELGRQNLTDTVRFEEPALEQTLTRLLQLDEPALMRLGQAARAWFLENRRSFPERLAQALATLAAPAGS